MAALTDLVIIAIALRLGLVLTDGSLAGHFPGFIAAVTGAILLGSMITCRVWEPRVLGQGTEELRRLVKAVVVAAVVLGLTALALEVGYFRPWVFGVLPATGMSLTISRYALRRALHLKRAQGRCMHSVLVAGGVDEVADLINRTRREWHYGWNVTGVCVPGTAGLDRPEEVRGVPVLGGFADIPALVRQGHHRVVAITPDPHWNRQQLRQLAWDLEGMPAELVVAPALMEVTGPRLHVAPVYGLTLLHVSQPTFSGALWVLKAFIDRLGALFLLFLTAPVFVGVAVAIKIDNPGPVLFRQQRVGKAGKLFWMLKFRSMVVDAEQRRAELDAVNEAGGPLFKIRRDPRITRVGTFLRRYSLDELPQLVNVLLGDMSLVGPRPPLPAEVARYGFDARRRLLVRPGLTGLWQVSGRSDLSWEETVQLDLRYVENWSLAMDAVIVWKTIGAVLGGSGAY
ncbi:MAG TPA: sugar transferase [Pseudonocardiaceae bacterium]|nr:sugar transferase [Pseudonocardiaceae bacterium]